MVEAATEVACWLVCAWLCWCYVSCLWPPYGIRQAIIFLPWFLSLFFLFFFFLA